MTILMSNLNSLIGFLVGILGFLFLFWRRLKEDYTSDQIFTFGFILSGGLILGSLLAFFIGAKITTSQIFIPAGLWFWGAFIVGTICFRVFLKTRFFETLEAAGIGFLFWFFALFLITSLKTPNIPSLLFACFSGALLPLFFFLDNQYKSFRWYKSGKVGFAGLVVLTLFFLGRSIVALINPSMLSFIGKADAIISIIVSFLFFLSLYNLSGRL